MFKQTTMLLITLILSTQAISQEVVKCSDAYQVKLNDLQKEKEEVFKQQDVYIKLMGGTESIYGSSGIRNGKDFVTVLGTLVSGLSLLNGYLISRGVDPRWGQKEANDSYLFGVTTGLITVGANLGLEAWAQSKDDKRKSMQPDLDKFDQKVQAINAKMRSIDYMKRISLEIESGATDELQFDFIRSLQYGNPRINVTYSELEKRLKEMLASCANEKMPNDEQELQFLVLSSINE